MSEESVNPSPGPSAAAGGPIMRWALAAAVAGFGNWVLYDARPGINWTLWTGAAVAGLLACSRPHGQPPRSILILGGATIVIAGATAVTASPDLWRLIGLAIVFLLAIQMLLTANPSPRSITARFAATAPLVAIGIAAVQAMRQGVDATHVIRSTRARARVRGLAITLPVLVGFALLLAAADPVFAAWRDAVGDLVSRELVPRVVFFGVLLVIVLGAYGYASIESGRSPAMEDKAPEKWLGSTERLMLLAGVAGLLWLFLAVQLGYLFGTLPETPASGVTFAEYARRGFGELSVVASASALLIVASERYGNDEGRERLLRLVTFAVIAAVMSLLGSAFRRVWLYEAAYGFTTARLYAQAYMSAVAGGLVILALEVAGDFDTGRLFRRATAVAMTLFIALIYWNHEAWIANRNIDRYTDTGKLDVAYLTRGLSSDAIPAIVERLPSLPEPMQSEIRRDVGEEFAKRTEGRPHRWFEWNWATGRARQALGANGVSP